MKGYIILTTKLGNVCKNKVCIPTTSVRCVKTGTFGTRVFVRVGKNPDYFTVQESFEEVIEKMEESIKPAAKKADVKEFVKIVESAVQIPAGRLYKE